MPKTANETYHDASLRHAIAVRRFTQGEVKRILTFIENGDQSLSEDLLKRLGRFGQPPDFKSRRWLDLLGDIRNARQELIVGARNDMSSSLVDFSKSELASEQKILEFSIPVHIDFATVSVDALREIVYRRPLQGHLLNDWFKELALKDRNNITKALQLGMAQGESIPDIVKRVAGTRANDFTDGALAITRRNAEAVVRTAVNHVSNATREVMWDANEDIIAYKRWVSTLDGRTSAICRANDGKGIQVGEKPLPDGIEPVMPEGLRPPAHINCRSLVVAVLDGEGILGNRPQVIDTRTAKNRELDFAAQARAEGRPIQEIRSEWADDHIGETPAATTYQDFLKKQDLSFQEEVLGTARAKLFRYGDVTLDQFIDRRGNELTLEELSKKF